MKITWNWALLLGVGVAAFAEDEPKVEYKPLSIAALQEFGQLRSGQYGQYPNDFENEWVDHFGAFFLERASVGERLEMEVGLGGVFQYQKPEVISAGWGGSQYRNFFVGPSRATLTWRGGEPENPGFTATAGMFAFKYNPDAANLGEYLFRANPYPNYLQTGGYAIIGTADAYLQGAKAEFRLGSTNVTLLALTETGFPPLYDLSLAALATYKTLDGSLEIGGGVNAKRIVPVRPSRTDPRQANNAYFKKAGTWYTGNPNYYRSRLEFAASRHRSADSAYWKAALDSVLYWTTTDTVPGPTGGPAVAYAHPDYQYYSAAGIILMARASLDPKPWFSSAALGPQDLKLYGELALLGVKDYPVFYPRMADRIPMMFGFNLPAFRLLDRVAVQGELYRSPFLNSTERVATVGLPQPFQPRGGDAAYSSDNYYDAAKLDDWSWSVLLEKNILPGITVSAQAARDHLRLVSLNTWFGPALEADENLSTSKDWYWMCRIGIAI